VTRFGAQDDEKSEMFATWYQLAGEEQDADAAAFELRKSLEFNELYNDGLVEVAESGVDLESVPEDCQDSTKDKLAEAQSLVDDL
jgi:hypothetical protein